MRSSKSWVIPGQLLQRQNRSLQAVFQKQDNGELGDVIYIDIQRVFHWELGSKENTRLIKLSN